MCGIFVCTLSPTGPFRPAQPSEHPTGGYREACPSSFDEEMDALISQGQDDLAVTFGSRLGDGIDASVLRSLALAGAHVPPARRRR